MRKLAVPEVVSSVNRFHRTVCDGRDFTERGRREEFLKRAQALVVDVLDNNDRAGRQDHLRVGGTQERFELPVELVLQRSA